MPKFETKMEIDAPVEKVWEVMINPQYWPQWFPAVDSITHAMPLKRGRRLRVSE